jgi:hypothetical protein
MDGERREHIEELCYLGVELWRLMYVSPSAWEFGQWDSSSGLGYIVVFPVLLQDDDQAAPRKLFWIR